VSERNQIRLVLHGAIVLFVALLFGFPFGAALGAGWGDESVRAWRVAHSGVAAVGLTLIAIGAARPQLVLGQHGASWLVWSLAASAYAFTLALLLRGIAGVRGFQPTGSPLNLVVFACNVVGVLGSLIGMMLTVRGAFAALRRSAAE
jgi:hypothetical protein